MTGAFPIAQGHGYPRPGLERAEWASLNGPWDFALDEGRWSAPGHVTWDRIILVPFAPETPASGVYEATMPRSCWYRRTFTAPALQPGDRLILHFGAVDYAATVWVNDVPAGSHEGGYTPFALDITNNLRIDAAEQTVTVRVEDDPCDLDKPIGKQDWQMPVRPGRHPRTTGIWQTVWLERQPATAITSIEWAPDLDRWALGLRITVDGVPREDLRVSVQVRIGEGLDRTLLVDDTYFLVGAAVERRLHLTVTSPGGSPEATTWSPENPVLLRARIRLWALRGELLDEITSYTAMRDIRTDGDRILLNGEPYPLRMVIDDGVWSDTGITPPDDSALNLDVQLMKDLGFNGVYKVQKIEDPRFLYWADVLGLLVWESLPGLPQINSRAVGRAITEWTAAITRDRNHPSVVAWLPCDHRADVAGHAFGHALCQVTRAIDPSRPIAGQRLDSLLAGDVRTFPGWVDGGSDYLPSLQGGGLAPTVASAVGRVTMSARDEGEAGNRSAVESSEAFGLDIARVMAGVHAAHGLAGFCYHRFTDVYGDDTGLVDVHRTPKLPPDQIARLVNPSPGS
ncbi:MAG: sugar-binding domain-containing protein [Thermomicrobiales bacterium]